MLLYVHVNSIIKNEELSCIPNNMVHDLKIVHPVEENYVEQVTTVSGNLFCYNPELCKDLINIWYLCVTVKPNFKYQGNQHISSEMNHTICGSIFDDVAIDMLENIVEQTIVMSLCSDEQGCVCKHEIDIKCCLFDNELEQIQQHSRIEKFEYMRKTIDKYIHTMNSNIYINNMLNLFEHEVIYNQLIQQYNISISAVINNNKNIYKIYRQQQSMLITNHSKFCKLHIGIKSSALNFEKREAIRNTWLNYAYGAFLNDYFQYTLTRLNLHIENEHVPIDIFGYDVCVHFVIGSVNPFDSMIQKEKVLQLLQYEQSMYQDLLINEVEMDFISSFVVRHPIYDSYHNLINKTMYYYRYVHQRNEAYTRFHQYIYAGNIPKNQYVLVVDDDAYVNIPYMFNMYIHILPSTFLYTGRVFEDELSWKMKPIRKPKTHRNYISLEEFSYKYLPRYVHGAGILLSIDTCNYIHDTYYEDMLSARAGTVGTLEDVTIAMWLLHYPDKYVIANQPNQDFRMDPSDVDSIIHSDSIQATYDSRYQMYDSIYYQNVTACENSLAVSDNQIDAEQYSCMLPLPRLVTSDVPAQDMKKYHVDTITLMKLLDEMEWKG